MKRTICLMLSVLFILCPITSFAILDNEGFIPVWSDDVIETFNQIQNRVELNLDSEAAILMEEDSGTILYTKNEHTKLRPASVTKVMTILLIMEALERGDITLEDKVPCSERARKMGGSQIWLAENETLTVHEMLKAICVVSANDCCVAMSEFISGSEEAFVQKMNDKAKQLGMNDTCFKNSHGIDEDGHVTSSYDIALMSKELLNNHPIITEYTTIWMDSLRNGTSELTNTNKLVRTYNGCTGLKTGSTSLALYNLSASATRDNLSLIAVVLRAPTTKIRFSEAKKLLDYGFTSYEYKDLGKKYSIIQNVNFTKGSVNNVNLILENDCGSLIKKGDSKNIQQEISINENICAPINKGDVLGNVKFYIDGNLISTVNLIAESEVPKKNLINTFEYISTLWFNILR